MFEVEVRNVAGEATAVGNAGPYTLVLDRPADGGGRGLGFNGGQLLYLSIAACWSNDLYREATTMGIELDGVEVAVDGDFPSRGSGSTPISVVVVVRSSAPEERVRELIAEVERVAEIPRAIRDAPAIEVKASVERR
jgi:putative redox protein